MDYQQRLIGTLVCVIIFFVYLMIKSLTKNK